LLAKSLTKTAQKQKLRCRGIAVWVRVSLLYSRLISAAGSLEWFAVKIIVRIKEAGRDGGVHIVPYFTTFCTESQVPFLKKGAWYLAYCCLRNRG
jgi:hypothetical protein